MDCPRRILANARFLTIFLGLGLTASEAGAQTCTQTVSPGASLSSVVSSAAAGAVVCLNSGSYGSVTFSGITKNPRVTLRSVSGRTATVRPTFQSGTNGLTLSDLTITGADFSGNTTRNITIQNSTFTGHVVFNSLANSNVLLDNNTHNNIEGGGQFSAPARIHLSYTSGTHSGVTIQNSVLDGGSSDGVQAGTGVNILNNVFSNIREGSCGDCHTDAIQLLTAAGSVIRGNYIHHVATAIVAFDGVERATIENNVIDTAGRPWGIELYADEGSVVRHNTLVYRASCDYSQPCGKIALDRKAADPAGTGTIVVDNIATQITTANGSTYAERHHNLVRTGAVSGDITGSPTYVGGAIPTTYAGHELTAASAGKGDASSPAGSDLGIQIGGSTPQPPPAAPTNVKITS